MTKRDDDAKLAEIERRDGWKTMMSTPASRRVMWEQFEIMGIYQMPTSVEAGALAFDAGRRSLALQIMHALLVQCPDLYDRMVIENRSRLRLEQSEAESQDQ